MITHTETLVKQYLKENSRIPNPYRWYRNHIGKNVRHPHQLGVVFSSNIIFRRINHDTKNMFDHWLEQSELGQVFDKYPYFMRVLNYIHYRSTQYMREGFILRNKHVEDGTEKLRAFQGDRKYFAKHLYVLEKLGVICMDKRQYDNFVWINYDVVGRYPLVDKHRFRYSDDEVIQWKKDNRIYNLSKLDHRAKLEMLWSYQMGAKSHYDMFDDKLFVNYVSSAAKTPETFDAGFTDVNTYDKRLRDSAFEIRREKMALGKDRRNMTDRLPMAETDFQFGGMMNTGKKHRTPADMFEKLKFDGEQIKTESVPQKEACIPKFAFHTDEVEQPIEKQNVGEIDWDNVDLAGIAWKEIDTRSQNKFKRHFVSYLDDLFVEGLNESKQAAKNSIKFRKTIGVKLPTNPNKETEKGLRSQYYGLLSGVYKNVYERLLEEGADNKRVRSFIKWSGKFYFELCSSEEMSWYKPDQIVPSWGLLSKAAHENGTSGVNNIFFNKYREALDKKNTKKESAKVLTPTVDGSKIALLQRENLELKKKLSAGGDVDTSSIEKRLESKHKAKMKVQSDTIQRLISALDEAGVDPLTVL